MGARKKKPAFTIPLAYFNVPVYFKEGLEVDGEKASAYWSGEERAVYIEPEFKDTDLGLELVLHEMLHGISDTLDLDLTHLQIYTVAVMLVPTLKVLAKVHKF